MSYYVYTVEFDSFLEAFLGLRGWLHALPMIYQILIFAGLVALTVGVFTLIYYVIKGVIYLIIELIKASINLIKSLVNAIANHAQDAPLRAQNVHRRAYRIVEPQAPVAETIYKPRTAQSAPITQTTRSPAHPPLHCPECGENFTNAMNSLLESNQKVYCEYCGKQLEIVLN